MTESRPGRRSLSEASVDLPAGGWRLLLGDCERTAAGARVNAFVGKALVLQVGAGSSCDPKRKRCRRVRLDRYFLACY